jgi:hypothetical protein
MTAASRAMCRYRLPGMGRQTIRHEKRSRMAATYRQPSRVQTWVRSVTKAYVLALNWGVSDPEAVASGLGWPESPAPPSLPGT